MRKQRVEFRQVIKSLRVTLSNVIALVHTFHIRHGFYVHVTHRPESLNAQGVSRVIRAATARIQELQEENEKAKIAIGQLRRDLGDIASVRQSHMQQPKNERGDFQWPGTYDPTTTQAVLPDNAHQPLPDEFSNRLPPVRSLIRSPPAVDGSLLHRSAQNIYSDFPNAGFRHDLDLGNIAPSFEVLQEHEIQLYY